MRHSPPDSNACAGGCVPSPVAIGDVKHAFDHDEMLLLLAVNVQRHAIAGIRNDLKHRISPHGLRGRDADLEPFARGDLLPLTTVLIGSEANFSEFRCRHLESLSCW